MDTLPNFLQQMGNRLAQVRADAGKTQEEFAASFNVSKEVYAAYEGGQKKMPIDFIRSLHDRRDVDVSWLISGEGQRYNEPEFASA